MAKLQLAQHCALSAAIFIGKMEMVANLKTEKMRCVPSKTIRLIQFETKCYSLDSELLKGNCSELSVVPIVLLNVNHRVSITRN